MLNVDTEYIHNAWQVSIFLGPDSLTDLDFCHFGFSQFEKIVFY